MSNEIEPVINSYKDIPQEHQNAAILSEVASDFYKGGKEMSEETLAYYEDSLPYVIDYENSTDLGIIAVHKDTGKATIVYRGTVPTNNSDLFYDVALATGNEGAHPQQNQAKEFMDKAVSLYEVESCASYSKGGAHCIANAGKYNIPSVMFNPGVSYEGAKQLSVFGYQESARQTTWSDKLAKKYLPGYAMAQNLNNFRKGGYQGNVQIYRTNSDAVSVGTKVMSKKTHPNVNINSMPTREDRDLNFPGWHDLTNFYDRKHPKRSKK